MPVQLPGFYWDENKSRYFPIASKPRPVPPSVSQTQLITKRQKPCHSILNDLRTSLFHQDRVKFHHELLSSNIGSTCVLHTSNTGASGRISSFCAAFFQDRELRYVGDDQGWLFRFSPDGDPDEWLPEYIMHSKSEVSSISIAGPHCVATSFSGSVILRYLDEPGKTVILHPRDTHDVWTSNFHETSLILGAKNAATYLPTIESPSDRKLGTGSSVFAIQRQDHLAYTGCRNGSVILFDLRASTPKGQPIFEDRFKDATPSPVMNLKLVDSSQLLIDHMDGTLCIYDVRFARNATPVKRFTGHSHAYNRRQGFTVDPSHNFLFAAGADCRIRGWSLRTGDPFISNATVFQTEFPGPIPTLQVIEDVEGLCLYAGCLSTVYKYCLGQCH